MLNFVLGLLLFNYFCLGVCLLVWYVFPDFGAWMAGGARKAVCAWAALNWISPFDTLGFLRKLGQALVASFAPVTPSNQVDANQETPPDRWNQRPLFKTASNVVNKLSGFGLVSICFMLPLLVIDYLVPEFDAWGGKWRLVVLVTLASLARCLNSDLFRFIDRPIGVLDDRAPVSDMTEGRAA